MNVLVPLAEGFEEIEAVTIIDILRRAEINVTIAFIDNNPVVGSHNIAVTADRSINEISPKEFKCIVLPGGMPGSANLKNSNEMKNILSEIHNQNGLIGAICAAPIVPGSMGLLKGKKATCYPGFEDELTGASYISDPVIEDGNIITGKGPGCAIPFALKLVEKIRDKETAEKLKKALQVYWM